MSRLAIVSAIDDKQARSFVGQARRNERTFARALRHSRRVRFLRRVLPGALLGGIALFMLINWLDPLRRLPVRVGGMVVSGSKITMEQPRLAGFTRDARAYEMTARAAAQDINNPDKLELQGVRANFETQDRAIVNVTADSGLYDTKADLLRLEDNIRITSSTGYEALMSEAVIDVRNNHLVSSKPVSVRMMNGNINSNAVEVTDSGDTIRFTGGVRMTVTEPPAPRASAAADQE